MQNFYKTRGRFDFEEAAREGSTVKYRVVARQPIFIYYDKEKGLITRQEFLSETGESDFAYELRDIKMEVDDGTFELPKGYRKTALSEIVKEK